jgi:hypothetical protein
MFNAGRRNNRHVRVARTAIGSVIMDTRKSGEPGNDALVIRHSVVVHCCLPMSNDPTRATVPRSAVLILDQQWLTI